MKKKITVCVYFTNCIFSFLKGKMESVLILFSVDWIVLINSDDCDERYLPRIQHRLERLA